jgi:CRISPR system Cascade subunit CasB
MTTTQTLPSQRFELETRFLQSVKERIKNDNGAKADFKRALSNQPEHLRQVYPMVLPYLGSVSEWEQQHLWIPVACLSVFYPQDLPPAQPRNFGDSCRRLAMATNSEGADRRFRALLDLSLVDIKVPLTALVRQLKNHTITLSYPQLLADLRQWEHPNQYIQDQWARAFWATTPAAEATSPHPAGDNP